MPKKTLFRLQTCRFFLIHMPPFELQHYDCPLGRRQGPQVGQTAEVTHGVKNLRGIRTWTELVSPDWMWYC